MWRLRFTSLYVLSVTVANSSLLLQFLDSSPATHLQDSLLDEGPESSDEKTATTRKRGGSQLRDPLSTPDPLSNPLGDPLSAGNPLSDSNSPLSWNKVEPSFPRVGSMSKARRMSPAPTNVCSNREIEISSNVHLHTSFLMYGHGKGDMREFIKSC